MAKPGRKPKPTALKVFEGNPGKRPLNKDEPKPQGKAEMPDWLRPQAQAVWERIAPQLEAIGILTKADENLLAQYCHSAELFHIADELVHKEGPVVTAGTGGTRRHPAIGIMEKCKDQMRAMGSLLGLDPSSRPGLQVIKPKVNRLSKFKQG